MTHNHMEIEMTNTNIKRIFSLAVAAVLVAIAVPAAAQSEARTTRKQIKAQLGFVPSFFDQMPDEALTAAWEYLGGLEMNTETALPNKVKDLITVAVASQVPCEYCVYAGTKFASANGATKGQVKEAVVLASLTRHWSTILQGLDYSYATFKKEIDRAFSYAAEHHGEDKPRTIRTTADAYADIKASFGFVPGFLRRFPKSAVAPMWKQLKNVQFAPDTNIEPKYKELIGLAVAAQIPCRYCVYSHTKAAKLYGATDAEIEEAVAMAGSVRFWSTYLHGSLIDNKTFRKDIDRLTKPAKSARK